VNRALCMLCALVPPHDLMLLVMSRSSRSVMGLRFVPGGDATLAVEPSRCLQADAAFSELLAHAMAQCAHPGDGVRAACRLEL
jgi:hypothetical protein